MAEIGGDSQTVQSTYIYGLDRVLRKDSAGTKLYYQQNGHSDTVMMTNVLGSVKNYYEYDAFGNQINVNGNDINPFRYTGQYFDGETGGYYLRARYYDPLIGRFTQADTHWNIDNMIYGDNPVKIYRKNEIAK